MVNCWHHTWLHLERFLLSLPISVIGMFPQSFFDGANALRRGSRFSYTYYKSSPEAEATQLRRSVTRVDGQPIHKSILALDHQGMDHITLSPSSNASTAHDNFAAYLKETKNTICGRHPIGVLLAAAGHLQTSEWKGKAAELKFVRYEQSSAVEKPTDSSVSYASAYLKVD